MGQRHDRREVERLLRRRERDGLTYREVSEESGIPIPTLSWWSRKLEQERHRVEEERALVAVEIIDDDLAQPAAPIEIVVTDGVTIVVPASVKETQLQRVLRAVLSC